MARRERTCYTVVVKSRKGRRLPESQWVVQRRCKKTAKRGRRKLHGACRGRKGRFIRCR